MKTGLILKNDDNLTNCRNVCVINPDEVFGMHKWCSLILMLRNARVVSGIARGDEMPRYRSVRLLT